MEKERKKTMMMMSLERELTTARRLALEAGMLLRRYREGTFEVRHKSNGEVVTVADTECDALIRAGLTSAFPDDAVLSEETPDSSHRLSIPRVWIVDPMDGTSNFVEGGDEFCVSIGLAVNGRAVLGVVYNPMRNELFSGCEACGITLNDAPARVSDSEDLGAAHLTVSRKEWKRGLRELATSLPIAPMASVAYKLARVAAGLEDGTFYAKSRKQWDICGGVALVLAAGGRATLLDGSDILFNGIEPRHPMGIAASGPRLHRSLLKTLRRLIPQLLIPGDARP